jgi:hypothetical protein
MPFTSNQLSVISTVLARCATLRTWSTDTEVKDEGESIQEVQCLEADDKLYIAGNHSEHGPVGDFLNAYGVNDRASLLKCLAYADWLLKLAYTTRKATTGVAYKGEYSEQELKALGLADRPFDALSDEEVRVACLLLKGTATGEVDQKLGWFLRKFVGAGPLPAKPYARAKAKDGVSFVTNGTATAEVNVVKDTHDVHAELKLLAYLYDRVAVSPGAWNHKTVSVGGLKKTCNYCAKWIAHFSGYVKDKIELDVALPTGDDRPLGSGAGKRPLSVHLDKMKNAYLKAMFNGEANSLCADLAELKPVPKETK